MMQGRFPVPKVKKESDGCKVKIRRDKVGKVVGYEDNGKCSKAQVEIFRENSGIAEE